MEVCRKIAAGNFRDAPEKENDVCITSPFYFRGPGETEPAPLDFDELKTCLVDLRRRLADLEDVGGELQVLRDDYQQRIAGMVKAIAAVDRRHDRTREATELVASLATMRAAELVACYHRNTGTGRYSG